MPVIADRPAPAVFEWKRWPETDRLIEELIKSALEGNSFAAGLAERMPHETGTRFKDWVDHLVVRGGTGIANRLLSLGYERQPTSYAVGVPVFAHRGGIFPRIALMSSKTNQNGAADFAVQHWLSSSGAVISVSSRFPASLRAKGG
jgi:hypothetical protein